MKYYIKIFQNRYVSLAFASVLFPPCTVCENRLCLFFCFLHFSFCNNVQLISIQVLLTSFFSKLHFFGVFRNNLIRLQMRLTARETLTT